MSFFSYSHDRESRTYHLYLLSLLHWKIAISHHPPHSSIRCSTNYDVFPKFLQERHELCEKNIKKYSGHMKANDSKKNGHMKVHMNKKQLAMPKNNQKGEIIHGVFYLSIPSTTHPHICTSRSQLYDLFTLLGSIFGFAKHLNQVCLIFLSTMSSTKAFLEVGERRHAKALARNHTL